jgi:uracil-DNA glycosylase
MLEPFLEDLAAERFGEAFSLFTDGHLLDGEAESAGRRLANLRRYLEDRRTARILAIGEAAGYRGMRWSGIAFTSERQLIQWDSQYRTTSSVAKGWAEPSATIVHDILNDLDAEHDVILWNAVPAHPFKAGNPLSNRRPRLAERERGRAWAERLIAILSPDKVIAVGRTAHAILHEDVPYVRHPANGGATKFRRAMLERLQRS